MVVWHSIIIRYKTKQRNFTSSPKPSPFLYQWDVAVENDSPLFTRISILITKLLYTYVKYLDNILQSMFVPVPMFGVFSFSSNICGVSL